MLRMIFIIAFSLTFSTAIMAAEPVYDVVIYGGTSAGVTAAVQASQMGKSVVVVSPDKHLGGLSAGGLGYTDSGKKEAIGGLSREFYHRLWLHYQQDSAWKWEPRKKLKSQGKEEKNKGLKPGMWVFEPHAAEQVFEDFIAENKIPVKRNEWLDRESGVVKKDGKKGGKIVSIRTLSGATYKGRMFIDATYEGDLMAAAGVSYHVGRESNSVYGEKWNGVQKGAKHHHHYFQKPVDPYIVPGDPTSGLLPRISADPPGKDGEGDKKIQAYCFRTCLTKVDENRIPFPKPDGYDASQYELILRVYATGWRETFRKFDAIPNAKTDTNNHGPFSFDNIGYNYDYPNADYQRRKEIIAEHKTYQLGLLYFLANDPRVPDDVRNEMAKWGLAKDEFQDCGGWPHQLYVRESRRMIGEYVMKEQDCLDQIETPHSVGMGSYSIDSHNTQRYVTKDGYVQNEGDVGVRTPRPYEISYGSLVPRQSECVNLLVPVCCSSSHIAYGSIRMEPVFMILGQSAATAAVLSIDQDIPVQKLSYKDLSARLLQDGQILTLPEPNKVRVQNLPGILIDDEQAKLKGNWKSSSTIQPYVGRGYQHDDRKDKGHCSATFHTKLKPGRYDVRIACAPHGNRDQQVPITVQHAGGKSAVKFDETKSPAKGEIDRSIGEFEFGEEGTVTVSNKDTTDYVVIDAVRFVPVP